MQARITDYRNFPGEHCGSVAMRSLLHHYCGLALPEDVVFGLGAGLDCAVLALPGMSPAAVAFGRTPTLEVDLAAALGVDYAERPEPDDARAWQAVRDEVLAGRPTMLSGDIFYLDYRDYKVHFPAHRFVLLGFDDEREVVWIADRINTEPEVCSYGALFASRNPPEGLSTHNLWGRFDGTEVRHDLTHATRLALDTCARRMLGEEQAPFGAIEAPATQGEALRDTGPTVTTGIAGIHRLAEVLPEWGARDDAAELASYNASTLEKFGNGGGNFRRLYAGFLEWAHLRDPERVPGEATALARASADQWTALAHDLWATADEPARWQTASQRARAIADLERQLFEGLAEKSAAAPA